MSSGSTRLLRGPRNKWPLSVDGFSAETQVVAARSLWSVLPGLLTTGSSLFAILAPRVTVPHVRTNVKEVQLSLT